MKNARKPAKRTTAKASKGFTAEERAAMREYAQELKTAARRGGRASKAEGESDLFAKIAQMPEPDRGMATRIHAIVKAAAPALSACRTRSKSRRAAGFSPRACKPPSARFRSVARHRGRSTVHATERPGAVRPRNHSLPPYPRNPIDTRTIP